MATINVFVYSFPLFFLSVHLHLYILHNKKFEIGIDYFVTSVFITKVNAHFHISVLSRGLWATTFWKPGMG